VAASVGSYPQSLDLASQELRVADAPHADAPDEVTVFTGDHEDAPRLGEFLESDPRRVGVGTVATIEFVLGQGHEGANARSIDGLDLERQIHRATLRACVLFGKCARNRDRHHKVVAYSSDVTDAQWKMLEPLLLLPSKRGPKHGNDLRHVVDAMLYISHTGCQWRFLPEEFGPWTRVWSQFRRWSRNDTWARVLAALHATSRTALGREESLPSMVVIDTHLARGASNGGVTFHNQGGPYGRTNGAKRIVCVDVTGLPLSVRVVPASTSEAKAVEVLLEDLARTGTDQRLEFVLVDRGTAESAAKRLSARFNYEVRRVGWDEPPRNEHGAKVFRPIRHAWRVEVAHGHLVRRRRLARCFENTVASATGWLHVASINEVLRVLS
jgi:putative transposase